MILWFDCSTYNEIHRYLQLCGKPICNTAFIHLLCQLFVGVRCESCWRPLAPSVVVIASVGGRVNAALVTSINELLCSDPSLSFAAFRCKRQRMPGMRAAWLGVNIVCGNLQSSTAKFIINPSLNGAILVTEPEPSFI